MTFARITRFRTTLLAALAGTALATAGAHAQTMQNQGQGAPAQTAPAQPQMPAGAPPGGSTMTPQGATPQGAPQSQTLSRGGRAFLEQAAGGDEAEIRMGQLAERKGASSGVRDYGHTLVADHSAHRQTLANLAQSDGVKLPVTPPKSARADYNRLAKLSGVRFDQAFLAAAVKDHRKDISEYSGAARRTGDPQVAKLAAATLPTLHKHLDMAVNLRKGMRAQ